MILRFSAGETLNATYVHTGVQRNQIEGSTTTTTARPKYGTDSAKIDRMRPT